MRNQLYLLFPFLFLLLLPISSREQASIITGQTTDCFYTDIPDTTISVGVPQFGELSDRKFYLYLTSWPVYIGFEVFYYECKDTSALYCDTAKCADLYGLNPFILDVACSGPDQSLYVTPLPEGINIPQDLAQFNSSWKNEFYPYINYLSFNNNNGGGILPWDSSGVSFLAFRARSYTDTVTGQMDTTYGWIRMKSTVVQGDPSITIYDWATKDLINGVHDIENSTLKVFPNPTENTLYISNLREKSIIKIADLSGRVISTEEATSSSLKLDVSMYSPGVYLITVNDISVEKILKQ